MTILTGLSQNGKKNSGKKMIKRFAENISQEEIKSLELKWFEREIVLVDNLHAYDKVIKRLRGEKVFGFDTETRPSFKKGRRNKVALLQLATDEIACLFRINRIGIPDELAAILANPEIIKAGVAIHDDIKNLRHVNKFEPDGFIDLQIFVKNHGIESSGLKKLTAIILGFRISKNQQVTDWEAQKLTEPQMIYAATDAWVCYQIYNRLIKY